MPQYGWANLQLPVPGVQEFLTGAIKAIDLLEGFVTPGHGANSESGCDASISEGWRSVGFAFGGVSFCPVLGPTWDE